MTIKEAKLKAIKKAWCTLITETQFETLNLDENGFSTWKCRKIVPTEKWDDLYSCRASNTTPSILYAPKALRYIEKNNGWTRIEEDGSNIPETTPAKYLVFNDGVPTYIERELANFNKPITIIALRSFFKYRTITHFKLYTEQSNPVY